MRTIYQQVHGATIIILILNTKIENKDMNLARQRIQLCNKLIYLPYQPNNSANMPSDFPLPANVKEVLSRLPVKDQGEFI